MGSPRRSRVLFFAVLAVVSLLAACAASPAGRHVWLAPNLGSADLVDMFDRPQLWRAARQNTDVFKFYEQQILADRPADCPECGRNLYPELSRAQAFTRLNAWGIAIGIEAGVLKTWGCAASATLPPALEAIRRVEARNAVVTALAMDEPLLGAEDCQLTPDEAARHTAAFGAGARAAHPFLQVGDIEPYPVRSAAEILAWLAALGREGFVPAFFHLDVDRVHAARIGADVAGDLATLRAGVEGQGIPFGVIYWSDQATSDADYAADVLAWVETVRAAIGEPSHSVFQSWAVGPDGSRSIPANLPEADPAHETHTRILNEGLTVLQRDAPSRAR
jgi:hypothetical protein